VGQMRIGRMGKHQKGATAMEFAFVFPVFFMLFYGSLMYGLIFLIQLGLQHAAEDGVRAALRYPTVTYPANNTAAQNRQLQMNARVAMALSVAATQASWMNGWQPPDIRANICLAGAECLTSAAAAAYPDCNSTTRCQIVVTASYPYATKPVIPTMPGFGLLAPNTLLGRARVLLDGRAL
jgi:Flp pilus assembly protein TadG